MHETILHIIDAEKKASEIISSAQKEAARIVEKTNTEVNEKINIYREKENMRFNSAVAAAESEMKNRIEDIKKDFSSVDLNLDAAADDVLKRVLKTIYDE